MTQGMPGQAGILRMAGRTLLLPRDTFTHGEFRARHALPCTAQLYQSSISCPGNARSRADGSRSHSHAQEDPRALAELGTGIGKREVCSRQGNKKTARG